MADAAEVIGGKLYLLGGGWGVVTVDRPLPTALRCAIAVAFRVPGRAADRQLPFEVRVEHGAEILVRATGLLEVTRMPGVPADVDQRSMAAVDAELVVSEAGAYVAVARLGDDEKRAEFRIVHNAGVTS